MTINEIIDTHPLGKKQISIIILCGFLMVFDGFDVQAMSYAAPSILEQWGIDKVVLGPVFSAGLLGLMLGSLVLSVFSDRFGRRPILIISTFAFSVFMLLTPLIQDIRYLILMRFLAGFGLGAIMPNAMALCGEITPKQRKVSIMMWISCGFTLGAVLGGLFAYLVIPYLGWQSVFYFGGIIPLLISVIMIFKLPESPQYLQISGQSFEKNQTIFKLFFSTYFF
ncbi:MFS transporter [Rodentibacter myodis]|uniref:MFS transporter n=1 Tax=Rodentibacter myodis TaxID=1907939 RepID=UPI001ABF7FF4|nr:MFS transporter [Rodentibacter myodis]